MLALVCFAVAFGWSESDAATAFGFTAIANVVVGLVFTLIAKGGDIGLSLRRSIVLLVLFWVLLPIMAAIPTMELDGSTGWVRAYVDASSQVTTTGAIMVDREDWPRSFFLWQAGLQWLGGYASIVLALLVLAPLNMTAPGVHRSPFLTIEKGNIAARIGPISRSMLLIYTGASLLLLLSMLASGTPRFEAVLLTMGSISTGGFVPVGQDYYTSASMFGSWFGTFGMLFGALGFAMHWDVVQRRTHYWNDLESRGLLVILVLTAILFVTLGQPFANAVQNAISLISTAAIPMGEQGFSGIPKPVLMALVLVGGAAVSTAGGVKIIRFLILFRQTAVDLSKLSHPSSTRPIHFRQMTIGPHELVGLWAYVLGYAMIIAFLVIFLGLANIDFGHASQIAIAAISNAGPSYIGPSGVPGDLSSISDPFLIGIALAMSLGRIEILAAVAILSPEFWRE